MIANNLYSIIVEGDINVVDAIFKKHGVKYREGKFYPGKGFEFIVREDGLGSHPLINELENCKEVESLSPSYAVKSESI